MQPFSNTSGSLKISLVKWTLVRLLDEEIRRAGVDLNRGGSRYGTTSHVGCDDRIVGFSDDRDLFRFHESHRTVRHPTG